MAGYVRGTWNPYGDDPTGDWFQPGPIYGDASAQTMDLARRKDRFAQDQWGRQMEGLDRAQGAFGGSNQYWQQAYGNRGPGAMENWYSQYGNQFQRPTQTSSALGAYQQYMQQPGATTGAYQQAANFLSGPSSARGAYDTMGGQLRNPGAAERAYGQQNWTSPGAAERFGQQSGAGEDYWSQMAGRMNGTSMANNVYNNYGGQLATAGRSEQFTPTFDQSRANALYGQQQGLLAQLSGGTNTGRYEGEVGSRYRGADDVAQFAGRNLATLETPGMFEDWAQRAINEQNPAMERIKDQGLARINQEMARRGHFASGGASTAIGNYLGELSAREYEEKGRLAQGGQQMQLARLGQGQGLAEGSSRNKLAIGQSLQGLAGQLDQTQLAQQGLQAQMMGQMSRDDMQVQLAQQQLGLQAAGQSDQARLGRLMGLQQMGSAADQGVNANLALGLQGSAQAQQLAQQRAQIAQQSELARMMGQVSAANTADNQMLGRLGLNFNMAQGADSSDLARGMGVFNMAQGLDASNLARFGMWGNLAGQEDANLYRNLMGMGSMAGQAQSAEGQRLRDAMQARFNIDNSNAGLVQGFYGTGGHLYGQAQGSAFDSEANAIELAAKGRLADREQFGNIMETIGNVSALGIGGAMPGSAGGGIGGAGGVIGGGGGGGGAAPAASSGGVGRVSLPQTMDTSSPAAAPVTAEYTPPSAMQQMANTYNQPEMNQAIAQVQEYVRRYPGSLTPEQQQALVWLTLKNQGAIGVQDAWTQTRAPVGGEWG